ncbi:hypothetical protein [Maribacter aquivivus]|uniref:hypothetical protein n=1 Tax=Maribacter aquivivus TaxID=228958 RepID=UPI00249148DC|nr:hypothetical protein [Maribacter aquivivus]
MISKKEFLAKYNIDEAAYKSTKLEWKDLEKIYADYITYVDELEETAISIFNRLMKFPGVHSVRYRIKNSEHLIEKIIRKKIDNSKSDINLDNYLNDVTDLIGLRALHLFKEDWNLIHKSILNMWDLNKNPVANYRKGDSEELITFYKEQKCDTKEHKYGYRSVHYILETTPGKRKIFVELQIRTIYEEAWAEIDHTIRYPYDLDNKVYFKFLLILNRLSGSADEMGSFIQLLKNEQDISEAEFISKINEKESIISDLEKRIEKLNIDEKELKELREDVEKLKRNKPYLLSDNLSLLANAISLPTSNLSELSNLTTTVSESLKGIDFSRFKNQTSPIGLPLQESGEQQIDKPKKN